MNVADYVNESPPAARIGDLSDFISVADKKTPIDMYRTTMFDILSYGSIVRLNENDMLGRLLALGLVSATEAYFRAIFSACIEICPVARSVASSRNINLGGLLWHGKKGYSASAFEHASFASRDELVKTSREYLGFRMEDQKFKGLLEEYEKVCQMRHGLAHGDGFLPGRNAVNLEIPKSDRPIRIKIKYAQLQEVVAVVNTLVFTFNREMFSEMCRRWALDWRKRGDWNPLQEEVLFRSLWNMFHSADELRARKGRSKINRKSCMRVARTRFGL